MPATPENIGAMEFRSTAEARIDELRALLACATLAISDRQDLLAVAQDMEIFAADIRSGAETTSENNDRERFGGEESYWTLYRMLCVNGAAGTPFTLEEIWKRMARNYDMTGEKLESLEETIFEWADDLHDDALAKRGISGRVVMSPLGVTFATYGEIEEAPKAQPVQAPLRRSDVRPSRREQENERIERAREYVIECLGESVVKQAVVRKDLHDDYALTQNDSLALIDSMSQTGRLVKFKAGPTNVAYLASNDEHAERFRQSFVVAAAEKQSGKEQFDFMLGADILKALAAERQAARQLETAELWQRMHDSSVRPSKDEATRLNRAARVLAGHGLLKVGQAKRGLRASEPGTKRMSIKGAKSKHDTVFKIGLQSQAIKDEVKRIVGAGQPLPEWLEQWMARDGSAPDSER